MIKIGAVLIVISCLCIGVHFFKHDKKKIVPEGYDPAMYSQTFKWLDRVNINGVPVIKSNGWIVLLIEDRPYRKEDQEPKMGLRSAF